MRRIPALTRVFQPQAAERRVLRIAGMADLALRLRASSITGKNDGDSVAHGDWLDDSGSGNNPDDSASATYKTNIVNGLPVVRFAGASYLRFAPNFLSGPFTVIAVASQRTRVDYGTLFGGATGNALELGLDNSDPSKLSISRTGVATTASNLTLAADGAFNLLVWHSAGESGGSVDCVVRKNGVAASSAITVAVSATAADSFLGRSLGASPAGWWNGDIAELVVITRQISAAEIGIAERELAATYNITL